MWPRPGEGLGRVLAAEAAVEGLYREALTRWSPVAMAAALPTFAAAVTADASPDSTASTDPQLPPDPAAVEQGNGWATVAETVIVAGVAVLFAAAVVEAMEGLGIPLPSIGLPGLPGKRQESAGNPQVAPPTSRATVTRDQAKQSHQTIPDRPPAARPDPIPAPLAPNPQDTAAKPLVAPDLDPVVLAIVNDAATDMDAAQLHEAMRIVDETPALAQARDAIVTQQRDAAARTPHVVAQKVTAAIRDAEPTDGTVTLAAQRSAAAEVLDPDSDAMAQIAATAGHLSAAVQNQAVQAAALLSEDADELEKFWACVHPDTVVSAAGVSHLARRHFKGTLVSVRTASGAAVSLTPEHRVLTGRGWVEAQSLHMGDDLFKVSRADAARAPGVQDPPSSIGQVVDAAMDDPATEVRTVRRRVNLDGDTGSGYVNVVATDGDLAINVEPLGPQAVRDLLLADADSLGHAAVLRSRGIDNRRHRLDATAVLVGDASVELCLDVVGNLGRADYSCSRLVPNVDSRGGQDGHDRVPAGVVAVADRLCGLSAEVRLDDLAPGCGEVGAATCLDGELLGGAHLGNPRVGLRETLPVLGSRAHDATLTQSPADRLCAGAECGGDVRGRRSGRVATHDVVDVEFHAFGAYLADRVVEISSVAHDGYVYDLSTVSHWYLAGDLVVHNCTLDSRTRDTHWAADGARVPLTAPFIVGGEPLMFPADPAGSPAETYNCVPADTRVSGRATAAMLRRFRGRMFEVSTALGHKLSATANHSVLTRRGWRPVASLQPGDEIAGTLDAWTAAGAVDPHVANGEPTIEECARAIEFTGAGHEWVESGFVDLDSDVADGQVKVHRADLTLTFGRHTEQLKKLGEFLVQGSEGEVRLADHESSLLRVRHSDECLLASVPDGNAHTAEPASHVIAAAANGVGDGLDRVSSFPGFSDRGIGSTEVSHVPFVTSAELDARVLEASAHDVASHSEPLCDDVGGEKFGLVEANHLSHVSFPTLGGGSSYRHTDVLEAARDHFPTDAEMATDSANGVTGLVLSDDFVPDLVSLSAGHFCWVTVTQLTHRHFDGHVFDLTTEEGFYLTSGLISHNCRCRMGILARDEPLPTEVDRHTERLDGRDSVAMHREGRTQVEEIEARAARGNTRARDNRDGQGTVASGGWTAPSDQEYDMTAPAVPADDTATEAAAAEAETFLTFTDALFAVTGTPTDDRRMLASAIELGFRDFPLPLQWKEKTGDGHKGSVTVGVIESATLNEQGEVRGSGYMLNNENAYKALELIQHGVNRPSIDMADATAVLAFDDGTEVTEENFDPAQRICETYTRATVTACTIVAIPAFGQTRLALNPERESRDVAMTAAALTAAAAYQHPVYEPAMFADADPNLLSPMRLTMDPDTGHVFGFIATWKDKHRSVGLGHIKPPRSHTNYEHFHTSPAVHLSDGTRLPVGRLTVGIGHAPTRGISSAAAQAHYDNVEACWALGRITEHRLGIYFSGVVAPWASPEKVQMGLASPVSGDWRPVGQGNALELVAVLSVNTPGFLCKVETDATGAPSAMVASLSVADDAPAAGSWSLDELKAVFAQVLAEDRAATLQNADKSQMVNEGLLMATPEDTQATAVDKAPAPEVDATARMGELIAQFSGTPIEPPAAPEPEVVPVELTPTERMGELIAEFEGVYVELGIRKVKNAEYWGRPAGTPITPGMYDYQKAEARALKQLDDWRNEQMDQIKAKKAAPKG